MVENDQNNDEYHFSELDSLDNESMGDSDESNKSYPSQSGKKDIKRNALITVAVVIFIIVLYKIIGSIFFTGKSKTVTAKETPPPYNSSCIATIYSNSNCACNSNSTYCRGPGPKNCY